jgi:hypothetical protein
VLLCGLSNCGKQEDPVENKGTPLFSMQGTANGAPFLFEGGIDNYYMYTEIQTQDHGVVSMDGKLAKQNCPGTCGPAIRIYFRNYTLDPVFYPDSLFYIGKYPYYNLYNAEHYTYELTTRQRSTGNGTPQYGWDFGQNRFSKDAEPAISFTSEGVYPVSCATIFSSCVSSLTQNIYLTPTRVGKHTDFSVNHIDTFEMLFNSIPASTSAQVTWDFGDGNTGSGSIIRHRYSTGGVYKVRMLYINGMDTMEFCQQVKTLNIQKCLSNYQFTTSRRIDSLQFKHIVVEWTDANGVVYSSMNTAQDNSSFDIQKVESYQTNSSGLQTKKMTLAFSCAVSNGTKTIQLNNVKGTFAVAVPSF